MKYFQHARMKKFMKFWQFTSRCMGIILKLL